MCQIQEIYFKCGCLAQRVILAACHVLVAENRANLSGEHHAQQGHHPCSVHPLVVAIAAPCLLHYGWAGHEDVLRAAWCRRFGDRSLDLVRLVIPADRLVLAVDPAVLQLLPTAVLQQRPQGAGNMG